jgi:hypothetical protein
VTAPQRTRVFVVDRIEGRGPASVAVLVSDEDEQHDVPRTALGELAVEGAVLRVPISESGIDWTAAVRDRDEERRRVADATERLKRLSADDPGGDLEL